MRVALATSARRRVRAARRRAHPPVIRALYACWPRGVLFVDELVVSGESDISMHLSGSVALRRRAESLILRPVSDARSERLVVPMARAEADDFVRVSATLPVDAFERQHSWLVDVATSRRVVPIRVKDRRVLRHRGRTKAQLAERWPPIAHANRWGRLIADARPHQAPEHWAHTVHTSMLGIGVSWRSESSTARRANGPRRVRAIRRDGLEARELEATRLDDDRWYVELTSQDFASDAVGRWDIEVAAGQSRWTRLSLQPGAYPPAKPSMSFGPVTVKDQFGRAVVLRAYYTASDDLALHVTGLGEVGS